MVATKTPDQLREKAQVLRAKLREKGGTLKGPQVRALKKRIRRLQRRRRKVIGAARKTATTGAGEAKGA